MIKRWVHLQHYGCFVWADSGNNVIYVAPITQNEDGLNVSDEENMIKIKEPENQPFLDAVNAIFGTFHLMKDFGYDMEHTCVDEEDPDSGDPYPVNGIIKALDPKRQPQWRPL
jgi:hypothetical protein